MLNLLGNQNISSRFGTEDHEKIWQSWAQERAYRTGLILSCVGFVLSLATLTIDSIYFGTFEIIADCVLTFGCLGSLYLTRRRGRERYFVWWPILATYWVSIIPTALATGGIASPFFTIFMTLLLVSALVIQNEVRMSYIVLFVLSNILFWAVLGYVHPIKVSADLPLVYNVLLNINCILAISACIFGFLKTERDLAREFGGRYRDLADAQKSLQREETTSASKSAFLANVSHELRTPLGAILGYIDLLLNENYTEQELRDQLAIVRRNGRQLSNLVDELLDVSKIEAGRLEIERLETSPQELLREVYEAFSLAAAKKALEFTIKFQNPIPRLLSLDPIRLKQILFNMIGNAIKFTDNGSVEVVVDYLRPDQKLTISFRDTGRGLTAFEQEKLFQPFSQADASMARKYGGTGLGLHLSQRLAQLMGGDLKLSQSRIGEGSLFTLVVDAVASVDTSVSDFNLSSTQPAISKPASSLLDSKSLTGLSILIVDDTADNRSLIGKLLRLSGANVETADDGTQGVQKALAADFDLVLMDIQMPVLDGLHATIQLRERGFKKPIIALTAHAMKQDRDRCLEAGCTDYLTKPVNRQELVSTIKKLCSVERLSESPLSFI